MTARWLAAALVCAGAVGSALADSAVIEMTFEEVLTAARSAPPVARLAAEVQAAEATAAAAAIYPYNPELELEAGRRDGAEGSTVDRMAGLAQRFELAGQGARRRDVAGADLAAARAAVAQARRRVLAEAAAAFVAAVSRRELLAVEEEEAGLGRDFAALVNRRLDAGSATAVDLALAQAGLARAERGLAVAAGEYASAQARLAEAAGVAEDALVAPAGDLPSPAEPPPLAELLARALERRGDLAATRERLAAAEARLRLVRAEGKPDLTVAARAGREEGDDLFGVGLTLPLPLFNRNQGAIAEAEAAIAAQRSELAAGELAVRREVAAAHGRLSAALAARRHAEQLGVTPLEEGLALLTRAFEAGKIGAAELLLYRRELVEGRRQAVAAEAQVWEAAIELAVAAGVALPGMEWPGMEWMETREEEP